MVIILNISTNRKNHLEYFDAKIMIFLQKQSFRPAFLSFSLNFPTRERFVNFLKFIDLPQKNINRNLHGGEKKWTVFCPNCHASLQHISSNASPLPRRRSILSFLSRIQTIKYQSVTIGTIGTIVFMHQTPRNRAARK